MKNKETPVQQVVNHFFYTKGYDLEQIKREAKEGLIIYSRYVRSASQLITLAGSVEKAKESITTVANWAKSKGLEYAIETVFKKWLEIDKLEIEERPKKPYYENQRMVWVEAKKKWYVINAKEEWLEFADTEDKIDWR